jgi:hypothetical protein
MESTLELTKDYKYFFLFCEIFQNFTSTKLSLHAKLVAYVHFLISQNIFILFNYYNI